MYKIPPKRLFYLIFFTIPFNLCVVQLKAPLEPQISIIYQRRL